MIQHLRSRRSSVRLGLLVTFVLTASASHVHAQERVVAATDAESLFTSSDPLLNRNKQTAYHMMRELLEAGHWELADQYLTPEYIQHNPLAASGRDGVVAFFTQVLKVKPKPIPEKLRTPIVSVVAEGDLVIVATLRTLPDPKDASKTYTTTWFDQWRFVDGKAAEHWDGATK